MICYSWFSSIMEVRESEMKEETPTNERLSLPVSGNCTLKLEENHVEQLHDIFFNADELRDIKTLLLKGTEVETLPRSFTLNLGNLTHLDLEANKLRDMPIHIDKLLNLHYFNVSHNCLQVLPENIGKLQKLKVLNLNSNNLVDLPDSVCVLKNLVQASVSENKLRRLPENIGRLKNLERLDISSNMLEELPGSMSELENLNYLNCASNKISDLPEGFTHLNKLTVLNLSRSLFVNVPYCLFTGLNNITILDLSHNQISSFVTVPNCASKLRKLDLSYNDLKHMPHWIFCDTSKQLVELNLCHNKCMNGIDDRLIVSARSLRSLDVSNCNLTSAQTKFLQGLCNLVRLNMGNTEDPNDKNLGYGNALRDFPVNEMKENSKIHELVLCGVRLTTLPEDIGQFSFLQHIDLRSNDLTWLPDAFCDLKMLETCYLSNNELALLPSQMGRLTKLRMLSLSGNKLYSLPTSVASLQQLEYLDLYDNILEEVPSILKSIRNLKGLDLENNYFDVLESIEDIMSVKDYVQMKNCIRTGSLDVRIDVRKTYEADDYFSEEESDSVQSEDIGSENIYNKIYQSVETEEEDWDNGDSFNENFDPTLLPVRLPPAPRRPTLFIMESVLDSNDPDNFCPSDIHVPRIEGGRKSKKANLVPFPIVEGQFDDSM